MSARTGQARIYKTGEFILHLNGVDRVNSASYYTPEVLTHALVKEALKERLKDFGPEQADEILKLKICEPAMGSAAFLVEAIDQLAREYLISKQEQLDQSIDPSSFEEELGRVKHYIAVHNVYGVDLNPTAVELGALSLWLASIHSLKIKQGGNGTPDVYRPGQTPWFGLRLRAGNSLIGARRAVWTYDQLTTGKHFGKKALAPRQLKPGEKRADKEIYHFLVWDEDMAPAARDSLMKSYWKEDCDVINDWQKKQVKQKWKPEELAKARDICARIDELWDDYAKHRISGLQETECTATVWPTLANSNEALKPGPTLEFQERLKANLESQSGAFQRLKLLMDSWCSFYYWPLERSGDLPSREAWLAAAEVLLGSEAVNNEHTRAMLDIALGDEIDLESLFAESQQQLPDATKLAESVSWYEIARTIDGSQNFHHWELIFTEVLGPQVEGQESQPLGFDLMFGNPPWSKVEWKDAPLLCEYNPLLGVRDFKSAKYNSERPKLLTDEKRRINYRDAFVLGNGSGMFLNDRTVYPALAGVQTNLYKNFIERSWGLLKEDGVAGLLHPEGVFDDPRGGEFRACYYERLRSHFQFENQYTLFVGTNDHGKLKFSINIYRGLSGSVDFNSIFNMFSPSTISQCHQQSLSIQPVPGIKNAEGKWETIGHPQRVIKVTEDELKLFAKLFEDDNQPFIHARLVQVHCKPLIKVLEKFSNSPKRLADLKGQYLATEMFHEANAQRDGIITREDSPSYQPITVSDWIISGPHFFVGMPFNKTPRTNCTANGHYDQIDLAGIDKDYIPRAVYRPGDGVGNLDRFYASIPEWPKPRRPFQNETGEWQAGFWPIPDHEIPAWEALLSEPLKRYGIDSNLPGAKPARQFGYFIEWQGEVLDAVNWLTKNTKQPNSEEYFNKYSDVKVVAGNPGNGIKWLPRPITSYPKFMHRAQCQPANERTYIGAIFPSGTMAVHSVRCVMFIDRDELVRFSMISQSILADFLFKVSGRSGVYGSDIRAIPMSFYFAIDEELNTLFRKLSLVNLDDQASHISFDDVSLNDFDRRLALVELDVLVSIGLTLSIDELIQIFIIQFPVLKAYEESDQYDARGCRLPSITRKDAGAKELREARKNHDGISPVTVSWEIDNGNQTITKTFYPPFKHVDRIEEYKTAYRVFSERLGLDSNNSGEHHASQG